ncbi:phage portal protein [Rhizobium halophytocola]|uniref:Lambda family phage portal protein n=1 Tax=Rhizobium halophytocola TaxID=735519 RepID=A0ABS4E2H4_9HYPH|nr:phage portal protein [Rhizobium halophytocola]MBP1852129.1 lambda family phage portal protein [Rhizobium halophytocola]
MTSKPVVRVKAGATAFPAPAVAASTKATMRYLRGDRAGVLSMRRAVTRDARLDVFEAAERASALALDFIHNSGWIAGAVDQIVADTIGIELKLNAKPDLSGLGYSGREQADWCRLVEKEWKRWAWNARECDLAGVMTVPEMQDAQLRTAIATGEGFAAFDFVSRRQRELHGLETGTKVSLIPPHRCKRTTREIEGLQGGIFFDAVGRPLKYRFQSREGGIEVERDLAAGDVCHVMDRGRNPNSPRGITEIAPALKVVAQYDQLADATLTTALLQTAFAATIKSPEASEQAFDALQTLSETEAPVGYEGDWSEFVGGIVEDMVGLWGQRLSALKENGIAMNDAGRINHLGPGEEFQMHTAATPGSQYLPFSQNMQREMARCLGITFESFAMDHSNSGYSSVRMAVSTIWPVTLRRRERIVGPFTQALYERWLEEGIAEGRIPLKGGYRAFLANRQKVVWAEWRGPAKPSADPYKDALAEKVSLETGSTTLQRIYAERGLDWDEETEQIALEAEKFKTIGVTAPHGRSTGGSGAGPLGGAADGRRDPAQGEQTDG